MIPSLSDILASPAILGIGAILGLLLSFVLNKLGKGIAIVVILILIFGVINFATAIGSFFGSLHL